jgi:hypothetical protein
MRPTQSVSRCGMRCADSLPRTCRARADTASAHCMHAWLVISIPRQCIPRGHAPCITHRRRCQWHRASGGWRGTVCSSAESRGSSSQHSCTAAQHRGWQCGWQRRGWPACGVDRRIGWRQRCRESCRSFSLHLSLFALSFDYTLISFCSVFFFYYIDYFYEIPFG